MKLQRATATGHMDVAVYGTEVAPSLPRDTGEWIAVLNSAISTPTQDIPLSQDELIDRISFQNSRGAIESALQSAVSPALDALSREAVTLFGKEFAGITRSCEFDHESRECFIRARVNIASASPPEVFYERYQRLITAIADARNIAGVTNLDVDVHID